MLRPLVLSCSNLSEVLTQRTCWWIELRAGAAILSTTASKKGFRVLAVDNNQRRAPGKHILRLGLKDPQTVSELLEIIKMERDRVVLLFISPPWHCYLARERKLLKWVRKSFKIPVPFRSRDFSDMLPGIKSWNKAKENSPINFFFEGHTNFPTFAIGLGILVVLKNLASSLYWLTSFFLELAAFCPSHNVLYSQGPKTFWFSPKKTHNVGGTCECVSR